MSIIEFGEKTPGIEYKERKAAYALILDDFENVAIISTKRGNFLPGGGLESNFNGVFNMGKRILIPTMGTRGDIQPYIVLAKELNKAGFNTIIATHPCWRSLVEDNNVEFISIGPDIDIEYEAAAIRGKSSNWILGAIKTMKFMFKIIEGSSHQIKDLCKDVSLVVASHSHIGAAEAEASNIPFISVTLQPSFLPKTLEPKSKSKILTEKVSGFFINPFMVGPYNKIRKNLNLKPVKSFDKLLSPHLNVIPISQLVYPRDKFWEEKNRVVGYWFEEDMNDYEPAEDLKAFISSGEKPVVISLGAMGFESGEERNKLDALINSINSTGMRAVLQGFNKTLKNYSLPENVISVGSIPHSWLFKQAYCVIHHGGFGTTAAALAAGVPSITIPHVLDQYLWANKIHEMGAGMKPIHSKDLNEQTLIERINLLKESYTVISNNVKALSENIKTENGLEKTIDLIAHILNLSVSSVTIKS
jgi:sterol 3beta-glucosyltransferase